MFYATPDPLSNCFLSYEPKEIDTFPSCIGSDQHASEPTHPWKIRGHSKGDTFSISNMDGNVLRDQPFRCAGTYDEYSLESKRGSNRKMSITHAPVESGPLSQGVQSDQWNGSHQTRLPNPAKFLVHGRHLEEIPLPPSRMGSNTARGESDDSGYHPNNSYSSDTKKLDTSAGGWNLFSERLDILHTIPSSIVSPQSAPAREVLDAGNVWSNRLLRGEKKQRE
jgi:hypothetical protein